MTTTLPTLEIAFNKKHFKITITPTRFAIKIKEDEKHKTNEVISILTEVAENLYPNITQSYRAIYDDTKDKLIFYTDSKTHGIIYHLFTKEIKFF